MVFGYPGTTNEYLTSYAIEQLQNIENPHKIAIRTAKLNIINDAMESDELLRIKYASKAASVANAWKKWQGETKGLKRFNTIALKQQQEKEFLQWAADKKEYNSLLNQYKELYQKRKDLILAASYLNEAGKRGAEIVGWAADIYKKLNVSAEKLEEAKEQLKAGAEEFYKDYDAATDQKILVEMLRLYNQNLTPDWIPEEVQLANRKKGIEAYVQTLFSKSILADQENTMELIAQATPGYL